MLGCFRFRIWVTDSTARAPNGLAASLARARLRGHEPEVGGERLGAPKAPEVGHLGAESERGQGVDPAQAAQARDQRREGTILRDR